jgi:hydrogenase nickel insertion protein HypA
MHEFAIANHLVNLVEEQAQAAAATRVVTLRLILGEQSHILPEALERYIALLSNQHQLLKDVQLSVTHVPMTFICNACGFIYVAGMDFHCPTCQQPGQLLDAADQLQLESLEVV